MNLYECDPKKNKACKKRNCIHHFGFCFETSKRECAKLDMAGNPVVTREVDEQRKEMMKEKE